MQYTITEPGCAEFLVTQVGNSAKTLIPLKNLWWEMQQ